MKRPILLFASVLLAFSAFAQPCDPTIPPSGLTSSYTPGVGAMLEWDVVPFSVGVQVKAILPSGDNVTKRLIGPSIAQFLVPEALLSPGTYTWQVQAACSTVPPYDVTPISGTSTFAVAGPSSCPSTVTDVEGNVYPVVEAGGSCWMAENLKTRTYSDGSAIPDGPWNTLGVFIGAAVPPNGDSLNINGYGMLYNWYAVEDARGVCPTGWHVPTEMEWDDLVVEQDPFYCASCIGFPYSGNGGSALKSSITDVPSWNGTNLSGFSALPAGWRNTGTSYIDFGNSGVFWTASPESTNNAYYRLVFTGSTGVSRGSITKRYGHSVRCVQD